MNKTITQIEGVNVTDLVALIEEKVKQLFQENQLDKEVPKDEFLTRREVSELLGVSLVTLHKWDKKGILKPSRIGRRVRYLKSDVLNSLNKENE